MSVQQILRDVRTKLDLSGAFVEGSLGLREGELREIENGTLALDTARIDAMAELYGVSAADVVSEVPVADELEAVRVLLLATKDRNRQVSDAFRATVARVAWARRDLKILEEELGLPDRLESLRSRFRHEGTYGQLGEDSDGAGPKGARRAHQSAIGGASSPCRQHIEAQHTGTGTSDPRSRPEHPSATTTKPICATSTHERTRPRPLPCFCASVVSPPFLVRIDCAFGFVVLRGLRPAKLASVHSGSHSCS
jgi:transcriptional regulator with XRE-family HTH domain